MVSILRNNLRLKSLLFLIALLCAGVFSFGCSSLPFGQDPVVFTVSPDSIQEWDTRNWLKAHKYKNGYWFTDADEGTYILVALGEKERDYEIKPTDIRKISSGKIVLDLSITETPPEDGSMKNTITDSSQKPSYPYKLLLVKPGVTRNEMLIREHQRETVDRLRRENKKLSDQIGNLGKQLQSMRNAAAFMKTQLSDSAARIKQQNKTIDELQTKLEIASDTTEDLKRTNEKLREQSRSLKQKIQDLNKEMRNLNSKLQKQSKLAKMRQKKQRTKSESTESSDDTAPIAKLYFGLGEYELNQKRENDLQEALETLDVSPQLTVSVIGYADTHPVDVNNPFESNLHLSILRAWSVAKYLIANTDIKENNVIFIGSGPQPQEAKERPARQLRRVEIHQLSENPIRIR